MVGLISLPPTAYLSIGSYHGSYRGETVESRAVGRYCQPYRGAEWTTRDPGGRSAFNGGHGEGNGHATEGRVATVGEVNNPSSWHHTKAAYKIMKEVEEITN